MFRNITNLEVAYNNRYHSFDVSWGIKDIDSTTENANNKFKHYMVKIWSGSKSNASLEIVTTSLLKTHYTLRKKQYLDVYPKYVEVVACAESLDPRYKDTGIPMNSNLAGIGSWSSSEIRNLLVIYQPADSSLNVSWDCGLADNLDFKYYKIQVQAGHIYLDKYQYTTTTRDKKCKIDLSKISLDEDEYRVIVTAIDTAGGSMGAGASYAFNYDTTQLVPTNGSDTTRELSDHSGTIVRTGHLADLGFVCTNDKLGNSTQFVPDKTDHTRFNFSWTKIGKYSRYDFQVRGAVIRKSWNENLASWNYNEIKSDGEVSGVSEKHINLDSKSGYIRFYGPGIYYVRLVVHDGPYRAVSRSEIRLNISANDLIPSQLAEAKAKRLADKTIELTWKAPIDVASLYAVGFSGSNMQIVGTPERTQDGHDILHIVSKYAESPYIYLERIHAVPVPSKDFSDMPFKKLVQSNRIPITG